ncbi:MAG: hypothetical protein JF586_23870 [Burkholderiales bacterium]|nr:hypothetical protein [Burkholderiales bacterium]
MLHPLVRDWHAKFGDALPAGFLCRQPLADRWFRIHSLPASKRYAETGSEYFELLHRQNSVASHVLGENAPCTAFITRFGDCMHWEGDLPLSGSPEHVLSTWHDDDGLQLFALPVTWRAHSLDDLIIATADWKVGPVLLANLQRGSAYAPYDGGADLFLPKPATAAAVRDRFQAWASRREDGL